jgi:hypothetical protein
MKRPFVILAAVLWSGVSLANAMPEEKEDAQFINALFVSACGHEADPASLSYFQGRFEERVESPDQIRGDIQKSCRPDTQMSCGHVRGVSDLCGAAN